MAVENTIGETGRPRVINLAITLLGGLLGGCSRGYHRHAITIKVGKHFLTYLHTRVANAAPQPLTLQDTRIDITVRIVKQNTTIGHTTVLALSERLAQNESEV